LPSGADAGLDATDVFEDDPGEGEPLSFVIRLWREGDLSSQAQGWRGHITHVESRKRRKVLAWEDIGVFVREVAAGRGRIAE
jgi:hypothetical protein